MVPAHVGAEAAAAKGAPAQGAVEQQWQTRQLHESRRRRLGVWLKQSVHGDPCESKTRNRTSTGRERHCSPARDARNSGVTVERLNRNLPDDSAGSASTSSTET